MKKYYILCIGLLFTSCASKESSNYSRVPESSLMELTEFNKNKLSQEHIDTLEKRLIEYKKSHNNYAKQISFLKVEIETFKKLISERENYNLKANNIGTNKVKIENESYKLGTQIDPIPIEDFKYKTANGIIVARKEQTISNSDNKFIHNIKVNDLVKLYGNNLGQTVTGDNLKLSFADFGIWERSIDNNYTSNPNNPASEEELKIKNNSDSFKDKNNYYFFNGVDELKTAINKEHNFIGKTIATATKNDSSKKELSGNVTLTTNSSGFGNLKMNFENWYNITKNNIDLTNINGYNNSEITDWSISGESKDNNFKLNDNERTIQNATIIGQTYGPKDDIPTESVGVYNIQFENNSGQNTIKLEGSYGTKQNF